MKVILTETQLKTLIEQQTSNLTVPEQTLLGFLNRFLRGEKGEFENTPDGQLKKTMMFNSKTIYPIIQALLVKKNTGKKTYDDKTFNALFMSMDKAFKEMATDKVTKKFNEQKYKDLRYEFFNDGGQITNITYNSQY